MWNIFYVQMLYKVTDENIIWALEDDLQPYEFLLFGPRGY